MRPSPQVRFIFSAYETRFQNFAIVRYASCLETYGA